MVRILIAEAQEFFRLGLIAICERHPGWESSPIPPIASVRFNEALRPDVSVIDLSVFEPNGLKAIDHLRLTVPKTRVLVCSDCPVRPVMEKVRRAGASAFLAKSESPARFVAAMEGVLAGEPFLASASAFRDYPRLNPAERVPVHYLSRSVRSPYCAFWRAITATGRSPRRWASVFAPPRVISPPSTSVFRYGPVAHF